MYIGLYSNRKKDLQRLRHFRGDIMDHAGVYEFQMICKCIEQFIRCTAFKALFRNNLGVQELCLTQKE